MHSSDITPHEWTRDELLGRSRRPIPPPKEGLTKTLVLLDRDGTLNRLRDGYVHDPDNLDVLPGAAQSVRRLNELGVRVAIVTNQRGLALGAVSENELIAVHERLLTDLATTGAYVDAIHVCGHLDDECDCRKPKAGLVYQVFERAPWAQREQTIMVGDSSRDRGAAAAAGIDFLQIADSNVGLVQKVEKLLALCAHMG